MKYTYQNAPTTVRYSTAEPTYIEVRITLTPEQVAEIHGARRTVSVGYTTAPFVVDARTLGDRGTFAQPLTHVGPVLSGTLREVTRA